MKVLVTGANGFIGKNLCSILRQQGHEAREFRGDVRKLEDCKKNVRGAQAIYHLAAVIEHENRQEMREVNIQGTRNIVEAALKQQIGHFVFASSVSVYGKFEGTGNEETAVKPVTEYGKSKAEAEKIVWESQEMLPITILRPAIVMGANKYWKKIVGLAEKDFPLIGNGKNKFQIVYVEDAANAFLHVLGKQECIGEIYNVAEEQARTVGEIYAMIRKELGKTGGVKKVPAWAGMAMSHLLQLKAKITGRKNFLTPEIFEKMTRNRQYSIEKIRKTGWKPKYSTEETVSETVKEILSEKYMG